MFRASVKKLEIWKANTHVISSVKWSKACIRWWFKMATLYMKGKVPLGPFCMNGTNTVSGHPRLPQRSSEAARFLVCCRFWSWCLLRAHAHCVQCVSEHSPGHGCGEMHRPIPMIDRMEREIHAQKSQGHTFPGYAEWLHSLREAFKSTW